MKKRTKKIIGFVAWSLLSAAVMVWGFCPIQTMDTIEFDIVFSAVMFIPFIQIIVLYFKWR